MRHALVKSLVVVVAVAPFGCNSVLGVDEPTLDPSISSGSGASNAGGAGGLGGKGGSGGESSSSGGMSGAGGMGGS